MGMIAYCLGDDASAAEPAPVFSGEITVELQNDRAFDSDDPDNERNDAFATIEAALEATVTKAITLKSLLVLEPVADPAPGKDRFFDDHGLYVQELFGEYASGKIAFRAGKFGQKFGTAWDAAPGIWGTDFAEDYEIAEQIGVAADFGFGSKESGSHKLTLGTFFADTTFLSDSVPKSRGRTKKASGGPGNTEDFSSFSITLEGSEIPNLAGLGYHIAYLHRATDGAGMSDETGLAGGLNLSLKFGEIGVAPLVEYAVLWDQGGTPGTDVHYLTTSVAFTYRRWNVALSRTGRRTSAQGSADIDDALHQVSAGYAFKNGIGVNAGWRNAEESGVTTNSLGVLLDYKFKI